MTPTQLALHEAHKARLIRMSGPRPAPVFLSSFIKPPMPAPRPSSPRLPYETKRRFPANMPIARKILKAVATEFDVTIDDLTGKSRKDYICHARFFAVGLFLEITPFSLPAIGRHLGGRDHTTIISARAQAKKLFAQEAVRNRVDQIKQELRGVI